MELENGVPDAEKTTHALDKQHFYYRFLSDIIAAHTLNVDCKN